MAKQYLINTFNSYKGTNIEDTINVTAWLDLIRQSDYSSTIQLAREGKLGYESIKSSVPATTFNFLFNSTKKNKDIKVSTGLMYIDVDDSDLDISNLDKSKIFACYKSFGGKGLGIIVQVEDIELSNFKSFYESIINDLGLSNFYDKCAVKPTQPNALSYDPNLYYNSNSFIYSLSNLEIKNTPPSHVIKKEKKAYTCDGGVKQESNWINDNIEHVVRYSNLDEIPINGEYEVNWDGWDYIVCSVPFKKLTKNKNNYFLTYTSNLVYLNPWITPIHALNVIRKVNYQACNMLVPDSQLKRIVDSIFKYKNDGTLKPQYSWKKRYIVFKGDSKLTKEEKLAFVRKELSARWESTSCQKINDIIDDWDWEKYGKIVQKKIYKNHNVSKKTVEKYWRHFKSFVKDLNKAFKEGMEDLNNSEGQLVSLEDKTLLDEPILSEVLTSFISQDRAYFISEIGRSKSIYERLVQLGDQGNLLLLLNYMEEYWFMGELRIKFKDYFMEQLYSQVA